MTHSILTNQIRLTPTQFSSRNGAIIDTFLIHHQAGTNDDATINAMVTGSKQVSSNYTISNEGRITLVVDEDNRAWTSSSAFWDGRSITVEIENEFGDPSWGISNAALNAAAALLIDLRKRYNIVNVLGHRDLYSKYGQSYPTYCPGPNTVAEIIRRADNGSENDLTPEQDALLRNIAAHLYAGGTDAAKPTYVGAAGTVYNLLKTPIRRTIDGVAKDIPQVQDDADTNTFVRALRTEVAALTEAVKSIAVGTGTDPEALAAAIVAQLGESPNATEIAKAVRDEFRTTPLS